MDTVTDETVAGPHGPIPVRSYQPEVSAGAGLVWLHGGAFKYGDLDIPESDWVSRQLARAGITVVSVDYRLAVDGVRFPVPSDDVLAVWRWVSTRGPYGVAKDAWSIGGASAGGNLAASVSLQCRDRDEPMPRSSVLVYPVLHSTLPKPTLELEERLAELPIELRFSPELSRELNLNYVGEEAFLTHPHAFPGYGKFTGLPPTLVINADIDDLRPSGEAYADALRQAGVSVTETVEPETAHGYLNESSSPGASQTISRLTNWLMDL